MIHDAYCLKTLLETAAIAGGHTTDISTSQQCRPVDDIVDILLKIRYLGLHKQMWGPVEDLSPTPRTKAIAQIEVDLHVVSCTQ